MYKALRIAKLVLVNKNECKYLNVKLWKNPLDAMTTEVLFHHYTHNKDKKRQIQKKTNYSYILETIPTIFTT